MSVDSSAIDRSSPEQGDRTNLLTVAMVSIAIRVGYLLIKPTSAVSLDVLTWRQAIELIRAGDNPYLDGSFNWPPPWPHLLALVSSALQPLGVSFDVLFWSILILIETVLIAVTFCVLRRNASSRTARNILLVAIAFNPAAIVQVTQHGSLHVLLMVWVMLAIGSLERFFETSARRDWLAASGWLGLGVLTKSVPLALWPLLAAGIGKVPPRARVMGAGLLLGPLAFALAGVIGSSAPGTWKHLLLYSSVHGYFGISSVMALLDGVEYPATGPLLRLHAMAFVGILVMVLVGLAFRLWRVGWTGREQIALTAALILLMVVTFGPGYGAQYIYWLIPPMAVAWSRVSDARWRRVLVVGGVVVAITFTFDYLLNPGLGEALHEVFPHATWVYRMQQHWLLPADQALMRLPMFCAFVAILIEGTGLLMRAQPRAATSVARPESQRA